MDKPYKIREKHHASNDGIEDKHFDKITKFAKMSEANAYYKKVSNENYFTDFHYYSKGKWNYRASSCCSQYNVSV